MPKQAGTVDPMDDRAPTCSECQAPMPGEPEDADHAEWCSANPMNEVQR